MASASDLPTAFAKAERAAGRRLPGSGTAFLSVRDEDKGVAVPVARALAGLGFHLLATGGTAHTLAAARLAVEYVRKRTEAGEGPTIVELVRRGVIGPDESTVVCITGNGYKTTDVMAGGMADPIRLGRGFKEFEGWWESRQALA